MNFVGIVWVSVLSLVVFVLLAHSKSLSLCLLYIGPWRGHDQAYDNNKYRERLEFETEMDEEDKEKRVQIELDRYLHYYQRYMVYADGFEIAAKTRDQA